MRGIQMNFRNTEIKNKTVAQTYWIHYIFNYYYYFCYYYNY